MKTIRILALGITILGVCFPLSAQEKPPVGDWVGDYEIKQNAQLVQTHFKWENGAYKGTIDIRFAGIESSNLSRIDLKADRFHFEWAAPSGTINFDGELKEGIVAGSVQRGGDRGSFRLLRTVGLEPKLLHEYSGSYRLGTDHYFYIQIWEELGKNQLTCFDESGSIRALYPVSQTSFVAGPSLLFPLPIELRLEFVRDGHGKVTGAIWQENKQPAHPAPRVELYKEESVSFLNGGVNLAGTLIVPTNKGPHPTIVLLHGSGPEDRSYLFPMTNFLVRHGIALLGYDKRGVGGSTGDWRQSGFEDLAGDALAGIEFLKTRRDINPKQIGVLGVSQGGWLGPLAASRSRDVAFVISLSGPGVSPAEEGLDFMEHDMRAMGFSQEEIAQALTLAKLRDNCVRTGRGWETLEGATEKAKDKEWLPYIGIQPKDGWFYRFYRLILDYDPEPALEKTNCPVLALFGGRDQNVLAEKNRQKWEAALEKGGNKDFTLLIFPQGNHILLASETGSTNEFPRLKGFLPDYYTTMLGWLRKHINISR
jgi:pimeloyl-ACP methyl ester carboxylesterase